METAAIFQMHHCVAFQTSIVPVVFYYTAQPVSINPQVSHGKILKEHTKIPRFSIKNSQDFQFQLRFFPKNTANLHISRSFS
jgi:hypothetical protein